jgi:hypothetical protein
VFRSAHASQQPRRSTTGHLQPMTSPPAASSTLVVFLHSHSPARQQSKRASDNFHFFLRHGLVDRPDVTFSLLVEGHSFSFEVPARPNILIHPVANVSGYEFSHFKTFFDSPHRFPACPAHLPCTASFGAGRHPRPRSADPVVVRWQNFGRFVLISDAMRGPFVPPYERQLEWPTLATALLSESVKLVGASVNCFQCAQSSRACESKLHTEGGLTITDAVGLPILLRQWRQMQPGEKWDEIFVNEVGGPVAVRRAGFNVAAMQYFWRGHDFLDTPATQRKCALMLARSRALLRKEDFHVEPREVEENGESHVTSESCRTS